jgi:hypothetical protein
VFRLIARRSQPAIERDESAATTERPVQIQEGHIGEAVAFPAGVFRPGTKR